LIWGLKPVPRSVLEEGAHADHHASVAAAHRAAAQAEHSTLRRVVPAAAALAVATVNSANSSLGPKTVAPTTRRHDSATAPAQDRAAPARNGTGSQAGDAGRR
jgi:stearoyl-CoA desaturase (delta-9 desaturase)